MTSGDAKVSTLFADLIELRYSEFRRLEQTIEGVTNRSDLIIKLARATRRKKGGLRAVQEALNRLDGKIAVKMEFEYPKFYTIYPNATSVEGGVVSERISPGEESDVLEGEVMPKKEKQEARRGSLRDVVNELLDEPKVKRLQIIKAADEIDLHGFSEYGDPKLKSVIAAGLYDMMDYNMSAIYELIEQVEGKVADKYKVIGDDIYIKNFAKVAPKGAYLNENGVYQTEAEDTTSIWVARLQAANEKR